MKKNRMRQTEYRRRSRSIRSELASDLAVAIQSELDWLFRRVKYKVRRINRFRPKVRVPRQKLQKAYIVSGDLWELASRRMHSAVMRALMFGVIRITDLDRLMFSTFAPIEFSSEEFALAIEPFVGERIVMVTNTIKRTVGRRVVAWYNSPGVTMKSLVDQLGDVFSPSRARLIAQNEVASLHSEVQRRIGEQIGAEEWWWSTMRDQLVCTRNLTGPDGKIYAGCRGLHGHTFKMGMPMPPEGSHIGCRCDAIVIPKRIEKPPEPKEVIEGLMIQKADFREDQHPRKKDGKFAPKG